jgi:hypothetical protein
MMLPVVGFVEVKISRLIAWMDSSITIAEWIIVRTRIRMTPIVKWVQWIHNIFSPKITIRQFIIIIMWQRPRSIIKHLWLYIAYLIDIMPKTHFIFIFSHCVQCCVHLFHCIKGIGKSSQRYKIKKEINRRATYYNNWCHTKQNKINSCREHQEQFVFEATSLGSILERKFDLRLIAHSLHPCESLIVRSFSLYYISGGILCH